MSPVTAPSTGFTRSTRTLACDGVPVDRLVETTGTPVYVYSSGLIRERYRALDAAFAGWPHAIHYALKANSALAIVRYLRALGSSADANSGGEIEVALRAGFTPDQIVFTGVGKTDDELDRAVTLGLKAINAESAGELDRIAARAETRGIRVRVALRVNPDVDAKSHPYISTGLRRNKFGVAHDEALAICRAAAARPGLQMVGLHAHVGSQVTSVEPLRHAAERLVALASALRDEGIRIEYLDAGGGLGIDYDGGDRKPPSFEDYARTLVEAVRPIGLPLVLEPGRALVGPAGALIARVIDVKPLGDRRFVVLDAGMTDLLRPALYQAFHRIEPVVAEDRPLVRCDIVGPVCESSDTFGIDRDLPDPRVGDLVAVLDAGAYGSVMASTYNRRPIAPEILVDENGTPRVIRRRQSIDEMLSLEA